MRAKDIILFGAYLGKSAVNNKRIPLVVSWSLTERCNHTCAYCGFWNKESKELERGAIFSIIEELSDMGTKRIQFTGGEPLLREDLGDILNLCRKKNIRTNVNSNGTLVPHRIVELKSADSVSLSLDGSEDIHDSIRGKGSYKEVMEAARVLKTNNIRFKFLTVLSSLNLDDIDFMLSKAEEYKTSAIFQPATSLLLNGDEANPIAPPKEKYRRVISELMRKKRVNSHVGNSIPGLKHLYYWPGPKKIRCIGKHIFCRIDSNGDVKICPRVRDGENCLEKGFKKAFYDIKIEGCDYCWCASMVEMSLITSFNPGSLLNAGRLM